MTTISLTTKERTLLEDQKSHEGICIEKYTKYAQLASDPQLRNIFLNNAKIEQEHLDTLNQLLRGQVPSVGQQGGTGQQPGAGGQQAQAQQQNAQQAGTNAQIGNASGMVSDESLCNDMLMTEKYVSGTYDTAIFEFKDPQVRDILNHIQKEEQKHGEAIFKYMESRGMYNPK